VGTITVGGKENGYLVFLLLCLSINKYITFKILAFILSTLYFWNFHSRSSNLWKRLLWKYSLNLPLRYPKYYVCFPPKSSCKISVKVHNHIHLSDSHILFPVVRQCCKINSSFCGYYFCPVK
jgi:hypothetical protein